MGGMIWIDNGMGWNMWDIGWIRLVLINQWVKNYEDALDKDTYAWIRSDGYHGCWHIPRGINYNIIMIGLRGPIQRKYKWKGEL